MAGGNYDSLWRELKGLGLDTWAQQLKRDSEHWFSDSTHGTLPKWKAALDVMPEPGGASISVSGGAVSINCDEPINEKEVRDALMEFHPWRKGPFDYFGIPVDTEWRSDLKWERLASAIEFSNKRILDVGCGNGYYGWRMLDAGADFVLGCDPFMLYVMQFELARKYAANSKPHYVLPIGDGQLPENMRAFDMALSMGVLYHRTSPIDHLQKMRSTLRAGGELVMETLVIEGEEENAFVPEGRYAKMRNVWFLPTVKMLQRWIRRCGFRDVELIDVCSTTIAEQRATEWMHFESLENFLDPEDSSRTIEGYPGPRRALLKAVAQ